MDRRELLGTLGATSAALAAITGGSAIAQEGHAHKEGDIHEKCAVDCSNCANECNQGFHHCYQQLQAGKPGHAKSMHLCVDCGDVCATAAKLVARRSPLMAIGCQACVESCEACIAECEKLNDPGMSEVIASLRKCAQSCRELIKAMGGHSAK